MAAAKSEVKNVANKAKFISVWKKVYASVAIMPVNIMLVGH